MNVTNLVKRGYQRIIQSWRGSVLDFSDEHALLIFYRAEDLAGTIIPPPTLVLSAHERQCGWQICYANGIWFKILTKDARR